MLKLFLVGCPRSGTTLLQTILADRLGLLTLKETHFFRGIHRRRPLRALDRLGLDPARVEATFARIRAQNGLTGALEPARPRTLAEAVGALDRLLTMEARARGLAGWLEKSPEHLFFLADVRAFVPDARIVAILRDGPDVVASLVDALREHPAHWRWVGGLGGAIRLHNRYVRTLRHEIGRRERRRRAQRPDGRADLFLVRYEDLVAKDPAVPAGLARFLGVAPERLALDEVRSWRLDLVRPDEAWKIRPETHLVDTRGRKLARLLDPAERARVRARLLPTADLVSG